MNRNKQLRMWGSCLRGHATGGLQYGLCDEPDTARYNRMMEIAMELLDKTDDIDEEQAEGVTFISSPFTFTSFKQSFSLLFTFSIIWFCVFASVALKK